MQLQTQSNNGSFHEIFTKNIIHFVGQLYKVVYMYNNLHSFPNEMQPFEVVFRLKKSVYQCIWGYAGVNDRGTRGNGQVKVAFLLEKSVF